ncbi:MAG TPA: hypothetical protein VHZ24_20235 [Pirellulales bacterium]|jgi:hypothetical protein|nr:hypothetical protein [Pirellulales bacterium]
MKAILFSAFWAVRSTAAVSIVMAAAARGAQTIDDPQAHTADVAVFSASGEAAVERRFRAALAAPCSVQLSNVPLTDVLAYFGGLTSFTIVVDAKSWSEGTLATDHPIDYSATAVSIGTALSDILRSTPAELTWLARGDGSILITTRTVADLTTVVRVYPVRDLVEFEFPTYVTEDYCTLIDAITGSVVPQTWSDVGGAGSIKQFPLGSALIVSQTREVHEQVENLLAMLRQARDVQGGARPRVAAPQPSPGKPQLMGERMYLVRP